MLTQQLSEKGGRRACSFTSWKTNQLLEVMANKLNAAGFFWSFEQTRTQCAEEAGEVMLPWQTSDSTAHQALPGTSSYPVTPLPCCEYVVTPPWWRFHTCHTLKSFRSRMKRKHKQSQHKTRFIGYSKRKQPWEGEEVLPTWENKKAHILF